MRARRLPEVRSSWKLRCPHRRQDRRRVFKAKKERREQLCLWRGILLLLESHTSGARPGARSTRTARGRYDDFLPSRLRSSRGVRRPGPGDMPALCQGNKPAWPPQNHSAHCGAMPDAHDGAPISLPSDHPRGRCRCPRLLRRSESAHHDAQKSRPMALSTTHHAVLSAQHGAPHGPPYV